MKKTAGEAGWRISRYNIAAPIPGADKMAIANLFKGTCGAYTPIELYLLDELPTLDEGHPILKRFADRGLIVNFDERAALEAMGRCGTEKRVGLTVCPTMGCNFDCPYCFENHRSGKMSKETQDEVIGLAGRIADYAGAKQIHVTWFGGEPLLAPDVIEALSERLIALAETCGAEYNASIITNGYLLSQEIADMLGRYRVEKAQVTLDGIGEVHDSTRHLVGGGETFERITYNLRKNKLPFRVNIRHNVHAGNKEEIEKLKDYVTELAKESGNDISCYPALVRDNYASEDRGGVQTLCGEDAGDIGVMLEAKRFSAVRARFCMAHTLSGVGVDDEGNLYKCWEDVDKPEHSFGTASRWDPADPIATADFPDRLTNYLNTSLLYGDPECRECVWLPLCVGGCPNQRLFYQRQCLPFKDEPEKYVLALYGRIGKEKAD